LSLFALSDSVTGSFSFPVANTIFLRLAVLWLSADSNKKTKTKVKVLENKDKNPANNEGARPK